MSAHLQLFGAPRVLRDGQPLTFDTRKAVALLAYLAVAGTPQRRESLAALLWAGGGGVPGPGHPAAHPVGGGVGRPLSADGGAGGVARGRLLRRGGLRAGARGGRGGRPRACRRARPGAVPGRLRPARQPGLRRVAGHDRRPAARRPGCSAGRADRRHGRARAARCGPRTCARPHRPRPAQRARPTRPDACPRPDWRPAGCAAPVPVDDPPARPRARRPSPARDRGTGRGDPPGRRIRLGRARPTAPRTLPRPPRRGPAAPQSTLQGRESGCAGAARPRRGGAATCWPRGGQRREPPPSSGSPGRPASAGARCSASIAERVAQRGRPGARRCGVGSQSATSAWPPSPTCSNRCSLSPPTTRCATRWPASAPGTGPRARPRLGAAARGGDRLPARGGAGRGTHARPGRRRAPARRLLGAGDRLPAADACPPGSVRSSRGPAITRGTGLARAVRELDGARVLRLNGPRRRGGATARRRTRRTRPVGAYPRRPPAGARVPRQRRRRRRRRPARDGGSPAWTGSRPRRARCSPPPRCSPVPRRPDLLRAVSGRDERGTVEAIEEALALSLLIEVGADYDLPHATRQGPGRRAHDPGPPGAAASSRGRPPRRPCHGSRRSTPASSRATTPTRACPRRQRPGTSGPRPARSR
jgi:hypothetical protein